MIYSEILEEKYRVQAQLAAESSSIDHYIQRSHRAAQNLADEYGFKIKYADLPGTELALGENTTQQPTDGSPGRGERI